MCLYIHIYAFVMCCFRQGMVCSVIGIIWWFHHCTNTTECTYTNLGGIVHHWSCTCYTSYHWQYNRFVYTSISTNRWVMYCAIASQWCDMTKWQKFISLWCSFREPPSHMWPIDDWHIIMWHMVVCVCVCVSK